MNRVVIIGGTGLIGRALVDNALESDIDCRVVSRARTLHNQGILARFEEAGAELQFGDPADVAWMTEVLSGAGAVLCAMGESAIYGRVEYAILEAALAASVKRFVPNEFGLDTLRLPPGSGALFDEKQEFQKALRDSAMSFTIVFNGGIFDYFLPNLREYEAITTFGEDLEVPYFVHSREDLAAITLRAAFDPRCENQYIHLKCNRVTQREVLKKLETYYPDYDFPRVIVPREEILDGTHEVKAAIWINGEAGKADPRSIDASELFPNYQFKSVDNALRNRAFVFGEL